MAENESEECEHCGYNIIDECCVNCGHDQANSRECRCNHCNRMRRLRKRVEEDHNERNNMPEQPWVRHLTASDILDLQSLMLLLAGRDKEEREAAFKGILEIMNPVIIGIRSVEAIKPSDAIEEALDDRSWCIGNFVDHLWFHTSWSGSSKEDAKAMFRRLIAGTQRIDDHAASMLSCGFGCSAKYWLDIQAAYDKSKGLNQCN